MINITWMKKNKNGLLFVLWWDRFENWHSKWSRKGEPDLDRMQHFSRFLRLSGMWSPLSLDIATAWRLCYSSLYQFFWFRLQDIRAVLEHRDVTFPRIAVKGSVQSSTSVRVLIQSLVSTSFQCWDHSFWAQNLMLPNSLQQMKVITY